VFDHDHAFALPLTLGAVILAAATFNDLAGWIIFTVTLGMMGRAQNGNLTRIIFVLLTLTRDDSGQLELPLTIANLCHHESVRSPLASVPSCTELRAALGAATHDKY